MVLYCIVLLLLYDYFNIENYVVVFFVVVVVVNNLRVCIVWYHIIII